MVDSILTNQAPIAQQSNNNRSITSAAVSNASSIPEVEQSEQVVDITPRVMDQMLTTHLHLLLSLGHYLV